MISMDDPINYAKLFSYSGADISDSSVLALKIPRAIRGEFTGDIFASCLVTGACIAWVLFNAIHIVLSVVDRVLSTGMQAIAR